jgi:hypothetical protein
MQNRNAYVGKNLETLFANSLKDRQGIIDKIRKAFNIEGNLESRCRTGTHKDKVDVKLGFTCGRNVGVNLKSYKPHTGFNQLTRSSVANFCKQFNIIEHQEYLENIIVAKSKSVNEPLFPENERTKALAIFEPIAQEIVRWSLSTQASREILVLVDNPNSRFRIYKMTDVLENLSSDINFTKGGVSFGKTGVITLQRKGGNGSLSKHIPKYSIKHPGNDLQVKIAIHKFIELTRDYELANYAI